MKKKLKQYIKTCICFMLIIALFTPSYASLSNSDGSAFVTKAEFDSVLADLSSRLTLFESGINSKIDSQVTSYLDRNGIWKSKEQTIESNGKFSVLLRDVLGLSTKVTLTGYSHTVENDYAAYASKGYDLCWNFTSGSKSLAKEAGVLVKNIDKDGLLNITGTYGDGSNAEVGILRTSNAYSDDGAFNIKGIWQFKKVHNGVESIEWAEEWSWDMNQVTAMWFRWNRIYAYVPKLPITCYFFVNAGDKIICNVSASVYSANAALREVDDIKMSFNIDSARVY